MANKPSVALTRIDIIQKVISAWEKTGRIIETEEEYLKLWPVPVDMATIQRYIGSYNRLVRWAHKWFPARVRKINPNSIPPAYIPSASETDQVNKEVVEEISEDEASGD